MPCVKNGRVVPGAKGSCPLDSKWSETDPSFYGEDEKLGVDDIGNFLKQRYTTKSGSTDYTKAGIEGLMAVYGGGAIRSGLKYGLPAVMKQLQKLVTKKVDGKAATTATTRVPKLNTPFTAPKQKPHWGINAQGQQMKVPFKPGSTFKPVATQSVNRITNPAIEAGRKFSLPRTLGTSAVGAAGLDYVAPFTQAGLENKQARDASALATTQANQSAEQSAVDANATAALEAQKESDRVAGLGFFDKMKEPGYWDTSITGVEGDDRLSRMGDLLTYYGMPPSGRAAAGQTPSEMWKQRSIDAAAAVANASGVDSPYSKIGNKTGIEAIAEKVKKDFGNTWLPFDVALGSRLGDDEVEALAREMHIEIVRLADMPENKGKMTSELYEIAKKNYETR
jgi:hypothetical protein